MDCIFCQHDRRILAQTELSFAFFDNFPVSKGRTLVMPKRHVASLWEMTTEEYTDAFNLVRQVKDILQKNFEPQGFNVGVNCGEATAQWAAQYSQIGKSGRAVPSAAPFSIRALLHLRQFFQARKLTRT